MYICCLLSISVIHLILAQPVSVENRTGKLQLESAPISINAQGDHLQDSESRRFTYKDLENITHNFERLIGQGGFGLVYYGRLEDGTMVAAKMRSESSSHGLDEFLAEVSIFQPPWNILDSPAI
jgi:hypothetical protein